MRSLDVFALCVLHLTVVRGDECDAYTGEFGKHPAQRDTGLFVQGGMQDGHNIYGRYIEAGSGLTLLYELCCSICTSQSYNGVSYPLFSDVGRTTPATCNSHAIRNYDSGQSSAVEHNTQPALPGWFCTFHTETTLVAFDSGGSENGFNTAKGSIPAPSPPSPPPSPPPPSPPPPSSPTLIFHVTQGTTCESHGYFDILDGDECNAAAATIGWADVTICPSCPVANSNFPNGCAISPKNSARVFARTHSWL